MTLNERECFAAGVPPTTVANIARRLERAARDAEALGLTIFGGSGSGSLRIRRPLDDRALILAEIEGPWDGGDGGCSTDAAGLMRGE